MINYFATWGDKCPPPHMPVLRIVSVLDQCATLND